MSQKDQRESSLSIPSTYPVHERNNSFRFTTDRGIIYEIVFQSNLTIFPDEPFGENSVTIALTPTIGYHRDKSFFLHPDSKIEATVVQLLRDLFDANPFLVINYTCDTLQGFDRHRRIIFGKWYKKYSASTGILRINHDDPSQRIYAAALYHQDNPYKADIERVFTELFKNK
jgi:hypothetical protein